MTNAPFTGRRTALNQYGDTLVPAGHEGFGGEISHQREDALDAAALERARELVGANGTRAQTTPVAYDIGAGYGAMALKFAEAGCVVVACDIEPMPALRELSRRNGAIRAAHIIECDARDVEWGEFPAPDILYSQRFLHYLRFADAVALVRSTLRPGHLSDVYLSMSGIKSELGSAYPPAPLDQRFACLSEPMRRKHGINQEVCLYDVPDAERLAEMCGLEVVRVWRSEFGNIKLIGRSQA